MNLEIAMQLMFNEKPSLSILHPFLTQVHFSVNLSTNLPKKTRDTSFHNTPENKIKVKRGGQAGHCVTLIQKRKCTRKCMSSQRK